MNISIHLFGCFSQMILGLFAVISPFKAVYVGWTRLRHFRLHRYTEIGLTVFIFSIQEQGQGKDIIENNFFSSGDKCALVKDILIMTNPSMLAWTILTKLEQINQLTWSWINQFICTLTDHCQCTLYKFVLGGRF